MYRALTLKVLQQGIDLNDSSLLQQMAETTDIPSKPNQMAK